jgi:ribosomal protein S18 acetylase RimI-like enzyme
MSSRFLIGEGISRVENIHTLPLEDKGLALYVGWNDAIVRQLVERSKEEEIRRYTPRDAKERFVDAETAERWYEEKGHVVYALCKKATLEGIIWFARTPRPELDADYTFAIRMYESQRGKGLAGAFLEAAHKDFAARLRYEEGFWLEADEDNLRALQFYAKHGYEKVSSKNNRSLLVRK